MCLLTYLLVTSPTYARLVWTDRDAPVDSPRGTRTVQDLGADSPKFTPEHPVAHAPPATARTIRGAPADGPLGTAGRSVSLL
jgi:hypothetical protein